MRRILVIALLALSLGVPAASAASLPGLQTGAVPWGANDDSTLTGRLRALGLPPLPAEGTALHIHQHIDVYVNRHHVTVPADIGINFDAQYISPIHTHDTSGVIHIESPTVQTYTLDQFFGVWGVRLTPGYLGGYRATKQKPLRVYVNGHQVQGDFRLVQLQAHQEIAVVYGKSPKHIPKSYQFAAGL